MACLHASMLRNGGYNMQFNNFERLQPNIKPGCNYKAIYKSVTIKNGNTIEKVTSGLYRFGINYANMASVKAKIKDLSTSKLPWGKWQIKNYLIEHKGDYYVRMYPSSFKHKTSKTYYLLNGVKVEKQKLISMGLIKDEPPKQKDCFVIKLENLIGLGVRI